MRRLPPLNALYAFEAAARHMSFAKAADELLVTPTAISHQIRQLEAFVGQSLFRRRPRPVTLTEAGERLFPVLREGFDRMSAAVAQLDAPSGALSVTTTTAFASRWLIPRLSKLKTDLDLELDIEACEEVANLRKGRLDFAVRYRCHPVPDLECLELARDHFIPVMSPALLERGPPVSQPADLGHHRLIHFRWKKPDLEPPTWERFFLEVRSQAPAEASTPWSEGLRLSEEPHAIEAALAGEGVALVSDLLVNQELARGTLVRPLEHSIEGLAYYVTFLPDAPRRRAIQDFVLWARDEMAAASDGDGSLV